MPSEQTSRLTAAAAAAPSAQLSRFLCKPPPLTSTLKVTMAPLSPATFLIRSQRLTHACSFPRGMELASGILFPFTV